MKKVYQILRHLAANQRGIQRKGDRAIPSRLLVSLKSEKTDGETM